MDCVKEAKAGLLRSMRNAIVFFTIICALNFYYGAAHNNIIVIFLCLCLSCVISAMMCLYAEVKFDGNGDSDNDEIAG